MAKFIRDEQGELVKLSPNYVRKMIDDYRKTIPAAELLLTTQNTNVANNATKRVVAGMNELEELNRLYALQMDRIKIDMETEVKINKLFNTTGREIFYAMKILKQSSDLKMDLGLAKRQLGEVSVSGAAAVQIADRYTDGVGKVLTDPDSRRKVLGMVETLMAMSKKANLDATEIIASAAHFADSDVIDVESNEVSSDGDPSADDLGGD